MSELERETEVTTDETEASAGPVESATKEFIELERIEAIVEAVLFSTDRPQTVATLKEAFGGTQVTVAMIQDALDRLASRYAHAGCGFSLEEIQGGYQLRTKVELRAYLARMVKARPFRLSQPALEVLSLVAYKQPITKHEIDEIRGVESGHLLRALMERSLVSFDGKSELPGKPMQYGTTRKFLEVFGLRNIRELPSLSEIDQLIPEGIGEVVEKETTLSELTAPMARDAGQTYSDNEGELIDIVEELGHITTSTDYFEKEKQRAREEKNRQRAQDVKDAIVLGDEVEDKDRKWLDRYEAGLLAAAGGAVVVDETAAGEAEAGGVTEVAGETVSNDGAIPEAAGEPVAESGDLSDSGATPEAVVSEVPEVDVFAEAEIQAALAEFDSEDGEGEPAPTS